MVVGKPVNGGPDLVVYYYGNKNYNRGCKQYELANHLGNMLATFSDKKFGISSAGSSLISYYEPDIITAQNYYPFGMMSRVALPNSGVPYKFGFNGKMNDNDVKGLGLQINYGDRIEKTVRSSRFYWTNKNKKLPETVQAEKKRWGVLINRTWQHKLNYEVAKFDFDTFIVLQKQRQTT